MGAAGTAWCTRRKSGAGRGRAEEVEWLEEPPLSVSQPGFGKMKCAVGFTKDRSWTFAYRFLRTEAI